MIRRLSCKLVLAGKSTKTKVSSDGNFPFLGEGLDETMSLKKASQVRNSGNRTKNQHWWAGRVDQGEREKEA